MTCPTTVDNAIVWYPEDCPLHDAYQDFSQHRLRVFRFNNSRDSQKPRTISSNNDGTSALGSPAACATSLRHRLHCCGFATSGIIGRLQMKGVT